VGQYRSARHAGKSTFKLIVSDTTIMETLAMSGMEEMVTFYHMDGERSRSFIMPTNNQPRMRAIPAAADPNELIFEFEGPPTCLLRHRPSTQTDASF